MKRFRLLTLAAVVFGASTAGGRAYGYWHAGGSGTGQATTGTMTIAVLASVPGDTPTTRLHPDGDADIVVRIKNPNPYDVRIAAVATGSPTPDMLSCGVTFAAPTYAPDAGPVLDHTHASGDLFTWPGAHMAGDAPSECQGRAFTIPVTVTVTL